MKTLLSAIILLQVFPVSLDGKMPLDKAALDSWPSIEGQSIGISNDGRYITYLVTSQAGGEVLVVQPVDLAWQRRIPGASSPGAFAEDNKHLIFDRPGDGVGILDLANNSLHYLGEADSYKLPTGGKGRWLAVYKKHAAGELALIDLDSKNETQYPGVTDYQFAGNGKTVVLDTKVTRGASEVHELVWIDLETGKASIVDSGDAASGFVFDDCGSQLVFLRRDPNVPTAEAKLCYYRPGLKGMEVAACSLVPGMKGFEVEPGIPFFFSKSGKKIIFGTKKRGVNVGEAPVDAHKPSIWSYRDFPNEVKSYGHSLAACLVDEQFRIVLCESEGNDHDPFFEPTVGGAEDYLLFTKLSNEPAADNLRAQGRDCVLQSLYDGSRTVIWHNSTVMCLGFSPMGRYLIWYDRRLRHWYTYNIAMGITKEISAGIISELDFSDKSPGPPIPFGLCGWLENDGKVLLYDRKDIWKVDPDGMVDPVNLTESKGASSRVVFTLLHALGGDEMVIPGFYAKGAIPATGSLLLTVFDSASKDDGVFSLSLQSHTPPQQLVMEGGNSFLSRGGDGDRPPDAVPPITPVKAKNAETYVLQRVSGNDYPNLYITHDFKTLYQETDLEPQENYNWYTTELLGWSLPDGNKVEGILFKPSDFDPRKKYPAIVWIYATESSWLHAYIPAKGSGGDINIPWFVSHGYLVFIPDVPLRKGYPGASASAAVISGVQCLTRLPYVDSRRLGLQGHSHGGYEADFVLTETPAFAAACTADGATDLISKYCAQGVDVSWCDYYELRQGGIGARLLDRPDLYIENSPLLKADKVVTPLLILHNEGDDAVEFSQAREWFGLLASLNKRVWLLSYKGERHRLEDDADEWDYSTRVQQFFDYYLKGAPPPMWMTKGKSARDGGPDLGMDVSGLKP